MLIERRQWSGGGHSVVADNIRLWVEVKAALVHDPSDSQGPYYHVCLPCMRADPDLAAMVERVEYRDTGRCACCRELFEENQ